MSEQKQNSPFLLLPADIRLIIYSFALQETVASISATSFRHILPEHQTHPPTHGALSLLYTSSIIRSESSDAMRLPAKAYCDQFVARRDAHRGERMRVFVDYGLITDDEDEWNDTRGRMGMMLSAEYLIRAAHLHSRVEILERRRVASDAAHNSEEA